MTVSGSLVFSTSLGEAVHGETVSVLQQMESGSVDLFLTSPLWAIYAEDPAQSLEGAAYVEFLLAVMNEMQRVLRPSGSLMLELGPTWRYGRPERAVHPFTLISKACTEHGWFLLQEYYNYNPDMLYTPEQWVERDYTRPLDSVSPIWWLSRTLTPKVDTRRAIAVRPPSPVDPTSNLVFIEHGPEREDYERSSQAAGLDPHDDPFPVAFARYFIALLTEPGDLVVDTFAGSCTTGVAAEGMSRRWKCIDRERRYLEAAANRFENARRSLE